jgi:hypothetical protein
MQENTINLDQMIDNARAKAIGQYETTYGANVEYASLLNQKWGFDWFELKHTDTSDEGKAVKAEADKFRKGIKDWHSNPSTAWKQIRGYGRVDRYGKPVVSAEADGAEGEGEGSGDAKHNRSPELRNIEELTVLFKFNRRQESLSDNLKECQRNIIKALESMGVDIGMIGD